MIDAVLCEKLDAFGLTPPWGPFERSADDLLGRALAVRRSGADEVGSEIESVLNRGDQNVVVRTV
jgi:hypothetical protein